MFPISRSACRISCSRELCSRAANPARMVSFLFSRAQMTNGNPKRWRYAALLRANQRFLAPDGRRAHGRDERAVQVGAGGEGPP
jgi:hypothetical protein